MMITVAVLATANICQLIVSKYVHDVSISFLFSALLIFIAAAEAKILDHYQQLAKVPFVNL